MISTNTPHVNKWTVNDVLKSTIKKLMLAIATGDEQAVYKIITTKHASLTGEIAMAAIHTALSAHQRSIAFSLLVNLPFKVMNSDQFLEDGKTALYRAVELCYLKVASRLLDWGAALYWKPENSSITAFSAAVRTGDYDLVKMMVSHAEFKIEPITSQAIISAARADLKDILYLVIEQYKTEHKEIDSYHHEGKSALMLCITMRNDRGAAALVNHGAFEQMSNCSNLYHILIDSIHYRMHMTIHSILKHRRYKLSAQSMPAVRAAIATEQYDLIPLLLADARDHTIPFNEFRYDDKTVIELALEKGHKATLTLLLRLSRLSLRACLIQALKENSAYGVKLILESGLLSLDESLIKSLKQAMDADMLDDMVELFYTCESSGLHIDTKDVGCDTSDLNGVDQPLIEPKPIEAVTSIIVKNKDNINGTTQPSLSIWTRRVNTHADAITENSTAAFMRQGLEVTTSNNLRTTNKVDAATQTSLQLT